MERLHALLTAICLLCLCLPAQAFERRIGARPLGMGDAFLALADDSNALNYNPAGLAQIRDIEVSLEYANLYWGLDDGGVQENHLAYVQPLPESGLGLAWNNRSVAGSYTENEFLAAYALQPAADLPLRVGLAAKLFYLGYTDPLSLALNPYFADTSSKYAFGLDLGVLYDLLEESAGRPGVRVALGGLNLNQPDLGLHAESRQPLEFRLGGGLYWGEWDGALDVVLNDNRWQVHAGAEKWFLGRHWAARTGMIAGDGTGFTWTLGGSYAFDSSQTTIRISYAFNYSFGGIAETAGSHRLALDFLYGGPEKSAQASTASAASAPAAGGGTTAESPKMTRLKDYLFERIDQYLAFSQRLTGLPDSPAKTPVAQKLHEAAGQLILKEDILGFLHSLQDAEEAFRALDKSLPVGQP